MVERSHPQCWWLCACSGYEGDNPLFTGRDLLFFLAGPAICLQSETVSMPQVVIEPSIEGEDERGFFSSSAGSVAIAGEERSSVMYVKRNLTMKF